MDPEEEPEEDLLDDADGESPPPPGLGPFGQLASGVLAVVVLLLLFLGTALVVGWIF